MIDQTHLGIIVADVAGKGIPGAMIMTMARSLMRLASVRNISPADTFKKVNRILAREDSGDDVGHVSVRHPPDGSRYFLARSRSPEVVTRDDIMEFTLDGEKKTLTIEDNGIGMSRDEVIDHGRHRGGRRDGRGRLWRG